MKKIGKILVLLLATICLSLVLFACGGGNNNGGEGSGDNNTPVRQHIWNKGEITKQATCVEEGEIAYSCTVCGETKTESINKLAAHSWNNGEEAKYVTCKEKGEIVYTCNVCGSTKTEFIEKLTTHTPKAAVEENRIEATCKQAGSYDAVVYCSVCETEISRETKQLEQLTTHIRNNMNVCGVCEMDMSTQGLE